MGDRKSRFDASYLDHKRQQLTKLRDELRRTANAAEAVESEIKLEAGSPPREYEDDAQRLDMLETEGHLVARDVQQLARVERALAKITDGTYGFSDLSGQRIPDDRLEIMPDAILTITEQEANERIG